MSIVWRLLAAPIPPEPGPPPINAEPKSIPGPATQEPTYVIPPSESSGGSPRIKPPHSLIIISELLMVSEPLLRMISSLRIRPLLLMVPESLLRSPLLSIVPRLHRHYSYKSREHYAQSLTVWLNYFPREQLLILKSEDYFKDMEATLSMWFDF